MRVDRGRCHGCGEELLWVRTPHSAATPLEAEPERRFVLLEGVAHLVPTYRSHLTRCQAAAVDRGGRRAPPGTTRKLRARKDASKVDDELHATE